MIQTLHASLRHRATGSRKGLVLFLQLCHHGPFLSQWQITLFRTLFHTIQCLHVSMQETWETESAATLGTWEENFALHLEGAPSESLAHQVSLWGCLHLNTPWDTLSLGLSQDQPAPNLHRELHCSALTGKHTQGERQRYFAAYRYAQSNQESPLRSNLH